MINNDMLDADLLVDRIVPGGLQQDLIFVRVSCPKCSLLRFPQTWQNRI